MFFFSLSASLTAWANGDADPSRDGSGKLKCPWCENSYAVLLFLQIHVKSTHTNLPYDFKCPDCEYGCFSFHNYKRHRNSHDKHDKPPKGNKDKNK